MFLCIDMLRPQGWNGGPLMCTAQNQCTSPGTGTHLHHVRQALCELLVYHNSLHQNDVLAYKISESVFKHPGSEYRQLSSEEVFILALSIVLQYKHEFFIAHAQQTKWQYSSVI